MEVYTHLKLNFNNEIKNENIDNNLYCLGQFKEFFSKKYILPVEYSDLKKFLGAVRIFLNNNFNNLNKVLITI